MNDFRGLIRKGEGVLTAQGSVKDAGRSRHIGAIPVAPQKNPLIWLFVRIQIRILGE